MSVNFLHLRSFYAVASERSVSKAARRLNISQPTLSKQLKALEDRYKVKLIEGARPPLTLTSAGRALYEKAENLFGIADEIGALLGEDDIDSGALLRLGTDSPPYAAEFMAAFKAEVPNAQFRVVCPGGPSWLAEDSLGDATRDYSAKLLPEPGYWILVKPTSQIPDQPGSQILD